MWISGGPSAIQLLAQVADVGLDDVRVTVEVVAPDVVEDLRLGEHQARVLHEVAQQVELGRGEPQGLTGAPDLVRVDDHLEVRELQPALVAVREPDRPAQDRVHPGDDLGEGERLGDVVVAADRQPLDLVGGIVPGGEEEDGDVDPVPAQALA